MSIKNIKRVNTYELVDGEFIYYSAGKETKRRKSFYGVPVLNSDEKPNLPALVGHILYAVFFIGISFIFLALLSGAISGDIWKYWQASEPNYVANALFLFGSVFASHFLIIWSNKWLQNIFYWRWDKYIYPAILAIIYIAIVSSAR